MAALLANYSPKFNLLTDSLCYKHAHSIMASTLFYQRTVLSERNGYARVLQASFVGSSPRILLIPILSSAFGIIKAAQPF